MAASKGTIEIARVARQNGSGLDVHYEQLINGQPEHIPGYTMVYFYDQRTLSQGKTFSTLVTGWFLNVFPFIMWAEDVTNVDGVLVRSFGFQPSQRAITRAKKAYTKRMAKEPIAA